MPWFTSQPALDDAFSEETGLEEIKGFEVFTRAVDPSALRTLMLMGIDVPIRISQATTVPGNVAVVDPEGITFISPQLCERVAEAAALTH